MAKNIILWSIAAAVLVFVLLGINNDLQTTYYCVSSSKLKQAFRIAFVADMHSCKYGENAQTLISAVEGEQPDLVLFGGDTFDDHLPKENAEALLKHLSSEYPCYLVTGNNEYQGGDETFAEIAGIIDKYPVVWLKNRSETVEVKGNCIQILGVNDPASFHSEDPKEIQSHFLADLRKTTNDMQSDTFSILLSHRPEYHDAYWQLPLDLVLCGHAHGGQWRFPGSTISVLAPGQGLFPKYTAGLFAKDSTSMIVSRGLAKETTIIPRLYNPPELVIIDIVPQSN